jgi:hypothetical protein
MRQSFVAALVFLVLSSSVGGVFAADSCNGDACGALSAAATGCAWTNTSNKSIRLSVSSQAAGGALSYLAAGETYKEQAKTRCAADVVPRLDATFVDLPKVADETPAPAKVKSVPKPKPAVVEAAPEAAPAAVAAAAPVVAPATQPVKVAAVGTMPLPRAKPAAPPLYPPLPRIKPAAPVETAAVAPPPAALVAPAEPVVSAQPSAGSESASCGDACPPILFKVFDNCLWVLNLNPRAVQFEAEASGHRIALALEAADGAKADAFAEAATKGATKDVAAVHARFRDPFQSAGGGIPLYRARLGAAGACVKDRKEITHFTAAYAP